MFTVIVTGSRDYEDREKVWQSLAEILNVHMNILVKVGDCPTGVDKFTTEWHNTAFGFDPSIYYADWYTHGSAAGPIRNHTMVDSGADLCIAFPLDGSKGTKDCAKYASKKMMHVWFPDMPYWAFWASDIASFHYHGRG
jgi:hypothetical protein